MKERKKILRKKKEKNKVRMCMMKIFAIYFKVAHFPSKLSVRSLLCVSCV